MAEGDRDQSGSALIKITDRLGSLPQDLIEVKPSHDITDLEDDPNSGVHRLFLSLFLSACTPPSPTATPPPPEHPLPVFIEKHNVHEMSLNVIQDTLLAAA